MNKTYQPFIIDKANELINILRNETTFFTDEGITSTDFATQFTCEKLTEKFLNGQLSTDDDVRDVFTEEDFLVILNTIRINKVLNDLTEKGLCGTFDDEDGEEHYFLTEKGKEYAEKQGHQGLQDRLKEL